VIGLVGCGVVAYAAGARRAEVQINLCSEPKQIARALTLQPAAGGATQAWYFDSAALELANRGVVVRLRLRPDDTELTVKIADQDCARPPAAAIAKADGKCEYDLHGPALKGAVSLSRSLNAAQAQDLLAGPRSLAAMLSPAQVAYLREVVRAWPLPDALETLGPVQIQSYRTPGRPFVVETWRLPSGRGFAELSQKTGFEDARTLHATLVDMLKRSSVRVCEDQGSQARIKLEDLVPRR